MHILKLIFLGSISPLIGVLIYIIQLQINPYGLIKYFAIQTNLTVLFLFYIFLCAYICSSQQKKKNIFYFFITPIVLCGINIFVERIQENVILAVLIAGVSAPFHYILPYLYFQVDKYFIIPHAFPVVICWITYTAGEKVQSVIKSEKILKFIMLCTFSICFILCMTWYFTPEVDKNTDHPTFSAYETATGLTPKEDTVCVMRIYSDPSATTLGLIAGDTGHTFLTFLNTTTSDITVGQHRVEPNKIISIGKFGKFKNYKGVFYNLEVNRKEKYGWYSSARSTYMELTENQLNAVSTYLNTHQKGYSIVSNNCSTYSVKVWNSLLSINDYRYIKNLSSPTAVYKDIGGIGHLLNGNNLLHADYKPCYYDPSIQVMCNDYF